MRKNIMLVLCLMIAYGALSQIPVPGKKQTQKILILGGEAHLGTGKVIKNSAIAFEKGKITLVGDATTIRIDKGSYDEIIEAQGKHVYPGFIAPNSTLGITEIDAVRASLDFQDVGKYNPHVRSLIAYNTESRVTMTVRSNGVLLTQVTPRGGRISGTSSIVTLDAWNWEDAVYKEDDGIHLNWPRIFLDAGWKTKPGEKKKDEVYQKELKELSQFFDEAKAYHRADQPEVNIRFQAMEGLWSGEKKLFIHANYVKDIQNAILFAKEKGVKEIVLVGGYDAWLLTDMLKENNVSVMLRRVHDLPARHEDDIDLPYKLPYLLQKEGVLFCLENAGDMEAMNTRNLPFLAGTAATYGLTKEEALMAITLNTAKILGIDHSVGSIEEGKDATIIISTGDALDMRTNNIERAFIQGRDISLDNHHKQLYQKYRQKYDNE